MVSVSKFWGDSGSNPEVQIREEKIDRFTDSGWPFCESSRCPTTAIKLVILQNSFVFLALFLALALKGRGVSTSWFSYKILF